MVIHEDILSPLLPNRPYAHKAHMHKHTNTDNLHTNLSAVSRHIHVNDAAITSQRADPREHILHAVAKQRGAKTLRHRVVDVNGVLERLALDHIQHRREQLLQTANESKYVREGKTSVRAREKHRSVKGEI